MVSSEEEAEVKEKQGDMIEWDVDMECQLFFAMAKHKTVGINKHFHMACIWEKLSNSIAKEISTHGTYVYYIMIQLLKIYRFCLQLRKW